MGSLPGEEHVFLPTGHPYAGSRSAGVSSTSSPDPLQPPSNATEVSGRNSGTFEY